MNQVAEAFRLEVGKDIEHGSIQVLRLMGTIDRTDVSENAGFLFNSLNNFVPQSRLNVVESNGKLVEAWI